MRNKIIVFLFVIIMFIISNIYKVEDREIAIFEKPIQEEKSMLVNINYNNEVSTIDIEDYVVGVVSCEMPASFNKEALKALSVAARTFAIYKITTNNNYVLKTTTSDQCYIDENKMKDKWNSGYDKYYNKIKEAVNETKGETLTYNGSIIIPFYFSISNGKTENVENVFKQKLDYLVSVNSSWDEKYNYKEETKTINKNDFLKTLNIDSIENKDIIITRNISGRVNTIKIKNKEYKGTEFRTLFNLKSTDFVIDINDVVTIKTKGYGHGVGMSEYGANAMANEGYKYDEILTHYYKDVKIVNN